MLLNGMKKSVILLSLVIVFVLSLVGCGGSQTNSQSTSSQSAAQSASKASSPAPASSAAKEPIKVGMVEPLSGSSAYDGKNVVQGAQLFVEEINKAGGILGGRQIQLLVEDTATEPAQGVAGAQKLISKENIVGLLGAYNSSVTGAVSPVAEKAGIPFITGVSTSPNLTEQGFKFFFRMNGTSKLFADAFADKIMTDLKVKNVAFIYENGDWGRNSMQAFADAVKVLGGTVLTQQVINEGDQDIYAQMTAIKNTKPDAIYAVANTANAVRITNTAKELGITPNVKLFGEGGWTSPKYLELTGKNAEGVYAVVEYADNIESDINKKFVEAYKAKYNQIPDKSCAAGYRIAQGMVKAIEKAGSTDGKKVADALRQLSFETPTGSYSYDEKGQAHGFNMYLAQIKDGKPVISVVAKVK